MKNFLSILIFAVLFSGNTMAYDFSAVCESGQTLYYTITSNIEPYTVEVTRENTNSPYYSTYPTGSLIIPSSVIYESITYSVNSIGSNTFRDCSGLTSIIIPNSVTNIGILTFYGCSGLTSINIPNSITNIEWGTFYGCSGLTSITIPSSVMNIGDDAFYGCSSIESIIVDSENSFYDSRDNCNAIIETASNTLIRGCNNTIIPASIASIAGRAFNGCTELTSITIPNSVTYIGPEAFIDCSGITSITIGNSVTNIDDSAFKNCSGLTSILIPNSVISIGSRVLSGCSGLEEITIPFVGNRVSDTITSIYSYSPCFGYIFGPESYAGSTSVTQYNNSIYYIPTNLRTVTVTGGNQLIRAFEDCSMLTSITIPNTITSIGERAFFNCSGLTEITIPKSVTSIDRTAFNGCIRINTLNFNAINCTDVGVYNDDYQGFSNCSSLTTLNIGDSVMNIPAYAFYGCRGITTVTIPALVTSIGDRAFYGCIGLTTVDFNATNCTSGSFGGCSSLVTLTIGENVTNVPESAFRNCNGLTTVTIPNSVTSIGNSAFQNCTGITSVNFNATNCTSMGSFSTPTFSGCTALQTLNIGENVTNIPSNSFVGCSGLTSVYYMGDIAQWCGITFNDQPLLYAHNLYINNNLVIDLVIPESVIEIKPSAFSGATCITSVTIPNSVISIGNDAFYNCTGLTEVYIGSSVTSIGELAFFGCSALSSVTIPSSVISIGNNAFHNCSSIESITIGNGVEIIGDYAFRNCSGLSSVTVPNSVISIGDGAFSGCSGIVEITIPFAGKLASASTASETTCMGYIFGNLNYMGSTPVEQYYNSYNDSYITYYIPNNLRIVTVTGGNLLKAFYGCSMLTSITIGENVTNIGISAFHNCSGLTSFTIPNTVTSIGELAFYGCSALSSLTIPNSVTNIGFNAFLGTGWFENQSDGILYLDGWCLGYKGDAPTGTLIIREDTKAICDIAFGNCDLTTIIIPNSLRSIGEYTFSSCSGCNSIDTIYSIAENPPSIKSNTFIGVPLSIPIFVPCGKVSTYSNAEYWRNFNNIQENTDCTGVEENEISDLQIFPNPTDNILNITSSEAISEIEIVNILGEVVYRKDVNGENAVCDVNGLKSGVYFVRIYGIDTVSILGQRKFVKE